MFDGKMIMNDYGRIVEKAWLDLPHHYPQVEIDEFIVMPDHFHGILFLIESPQGCVAKCYGLPEIIRGFKSHSARQINLIRNANGIPVWQRGYYDHIIRNSTELELIRGYISYNLNRWESDNEYLPNIR